MPIGSLIGGTLGVWLQSSTVITLCGITVVLVGVYWMFDRVSRNLPKTEQLDEGYFNFTPRGGTARSNTEMGA